MKLRIAAVVLSCAYALAARADVVTQWNEVTLNAIRTQRVSPQVASRALAIVHASIYDAVNGITQTGEPYLVRSKAAGLASVEAAAVAAAHTALVALFPTQQVTFDSAYSQALTALPRGRSREAGLTWGRQAANSILMARANDGSTGNAPYAATPGPSVWEPTPPAFLPPSLPHWGSVVPFALKTGSQFRAPPPPALTSPEWTFDYNQVKELGSATSATRTAEQTEIGRFWIDGPGTATPPGHFNQIAQVVSAYAGLSVAESARLFALLNIAMADAAIAAWDTKYVYNWWRPITAIQRGDTDNNPATVPDTAWTPLVATPNHPDYVSGHATFSMAGATVLAAFFGTDDMDFTLTSESLPGVTRSFHSFSQAAEEAGWSRIYIGIHTWSAINEGWTLGGKVAEYVLDNRLDDRPGKSQRGH
jgi:hypothetical protein